MPATTEIIQTAIAKVNEDNEQALAERAVEIVGRIVSHEETLAVLRNQLRSLSVETVDEATVLGE